MRMTSMIYESPEVTWVELSEEALVCASPGSGGNEDVGYENWVK